MIKLRAVRYPAHSCTTHGAADHPRHLAPGRPAAMQKKGRAQRQYDGAPASSSVAKPESTLLDLCRLVYIV
jgi:hypothetical protein